MSAMMRGNLRMAVSGIKGAKWRSILTMTGVIVGIVAVVTIVGIGDGVKRQVADQITHFGKDLITVKPGSPVKGNAITSTTNADVVFGMSTATGLSANDVSVVMHSNDVASVAPLGVVPGTVTAGGSNFPNTPVLATSQALPGIIGQKVAFGDFWSADDGGSDVFTAVIGKKAAMRLFSENVPLGHSFTFHNQIFVVRGVFDDFASVPFSPTASFDDAIFIPYQTAATVTQNNAGLYTVLAKADSPKHIDAAMRDITTRLRQAHGGQQDFAVLGPHQVLDTGTGVIHLLTIWIGAVAAISLFIGGVGIMNIMLLTVTERMHEIGVRKAIGATGRQILSQFLLEATVLSLIGGVIGIAISLAVDGILYAYTDLKPVISWQAIAIATGVSLVTGIVFGVIPAVKAARKDPIEALRHE